MTGVRLAMASVLLWAGLEKARSPVTVASTLRLLGVPPRLVRAAAPALVAAELTVALGLIFAPGWAGTLVSLLALATTFAIAGLVALFRDEPIPCDCFGPGGDGYLGTRQLVAFPLWLAGAALLWRDAPAVATLSNGTASFAAVGLTLAALREVAAWRASRMGRGDRRSAEEMYVWLRR